MVQITKKQYKLILNVEVTNPDKPIAGGDYAHLNCIQGVARLVSHSAGWLEPDVKVTLDKVVDKGELDGDTSQ